jgi:hypothetical protein
LGHAENVHKKTLNRAPGNVPASRSDAPTAYTPTGPGAEMPREERTFWKPACKNGHYGLRKINDI